MQQISSVFSANGFPLWIAISGLMLAAYRLSGLDRKLHPFDRKSTVLMLKYSFGCFASVVVIGSLVVAVGLTKLMGLCANVKLHNDRKGSGK